MNKPLGNLGLALERLRAALRMISDRNLTSHTYDHELAAQVYSRLAAHCETMEQLRGHLAG